MLEVERQRKRCRQNHLYTHTHTHTFNGALSGTTQAIRYQKGKTNLDFTEARDSEWKWHQLGHMLCMSAHHSRQITTPEPHHSVFTGWMPFQLPNQEWDPPELFVTFQKPITMQAQQSHCPHGRWFLTMGDNMASNGNY